jgi:hypothetical protein
MYKLVLLIPNFSHYVAEIKADNDELAKLEAARFVYEKYVYGVKIRLYKDETIIGNGIANNGIIWDCASATVWYK